MENNIKIFIKDLKNKIADYIYKPVAENVNHTEYNKDCLMVYIRSPFQREKNKHTHQNIMQAKEIARLIGEQGYNVDVIDYHDESIVLNKHYDLIFDICPKKCPVYKDNISENTKKIVYLTGSNSSFSNAAELLRLRNLKERRGVELIPRRQASILDVSIERADAFLFIGNEYNLRTFDEFNLPPVHFIRNTGYDYKFNVKKLIEKGVRKKENFLYLSGGGAVHKGLDLLLEIFSQPNFPCNLYVCAPFKYEKDFEMEYSKELYNSSNILAIGFVDVLGIKFKRIAQKCSFLILPSCSEGMSGAVTTAMSAGIIPICSKECGYDSTDVVILQDCEMETLHKYIMEYSQMSWDWIEKRSYDMIELSKIKYSWEAFEEGIKEALQNI